MFYSIQGEGSMVGTPMVFLRLAGCNLKCHFCDTRYALTDWKEMDKADIIEQIRGFGNIHWVCITGGEPLIQPIGDIVALLKKDGYKVAVETNGTKPIPPVFDHIVVSPKRNTILHKSAELADELKFIIEDESDFFRIPETNIPIFIQPVNNDPAIIKLCLEYLKKYPTFRLSLQVHKLIGVC